VKESDEGNYGPSTLTGRLSQIRGGKDRKEAIRQADKGGKEGIEGPGGKYLILSRKTGWGKKRKEVRGKKEEEADRDPGCQEQKISFLGNKNRRVT